MTTKKFEKEMEITKTRWSIIEQSVEYIDKVNESLKQARKDQAWAKHVLEGQQVEEVNLVEWETFWKDNPAPTLYEEKARAISQKHFAARRERSKWWKDVWEQKLKYAEDCIMLIENMITFETKRKNALLTALDTLKKE